MADIKFRRGLYKTLEKQPIVDGTIYFTTDEHGMYVDISDNERIKINGNIRYYDSLSNFAENEAPPFSEDILYYIAKSESSDGSIVKYDALIRWDPTKNDGKGGWTQLNVTMDTFQSFKSGIENTISEHTRSISIINGNIVDIVNDIGEWTDANQTIAQAIANHATRLSAVEDDIYNETDGIEKRLADVITESASTTTKVGEHTTSISTINGQITNITDDIGAWTSTTQTIAGAIADHESRIDAVETAINGNEGIEKRLEAVIAENASTTSGLSELKTAYNTFVGTTYANDKSNINTRFDELNTAIGNLTGDYNGNINNINIKFDTINTNIENLKTKDA